MRSSIITSFMVLALFLFLAQDAEGKKRIILKPNADIEGQLIPASVIYIVNKPLDLNGKTIVVPQGSEIRFKRSGLLMNGKIVGNDTKLRGQVKIHCLFGGSFTNSEVPVSWLNNADNIFLAKQIGSLFCLQNDCTLILDRDIILDGSTLAVNRVAIKGKKNIHNCCSFKVKGNVMLEGVMLSAFSAQKELFLDMSDIERPVNVIVKDVCFDGCWNISRVIWCPYKINLSESHIIISGSIFTRISNYVVQFRSSCTGVLDGNRIENVGTEVLSNVVGFHLGDSDINEPRLCANGFEIINNDFIDFIVPHSINDDGREAHALLIYGHNNLVRGNRVANFYSSLTTNGDPGKDCEGIYLKGGNNIVEDNFLEHCVGSGPDGAITIKTTYGNNRITGNTIKHKFGIGIQCYTPNSFIENNKIFSEDIAEEGIALLSNNNSIIRNNELYSSTDGNKYHAALALTSCKDIQIYENKFINTSGLLTTYRCTGSIAFQSNLVVLDNKLYGKNTYYSAPINLHNDTASFDVSDNVFRVKGIKTSQIIEAPEEFNGRLVMENNIFDITDTGNVSSSITYLVRNVKNLIIKQDNHSRIGKVSNVNQYIIE